MYRKSYLLIHPNFRNYIKGQKIIGPIGLLCQKIIRSFLGFEWFNDPHGISCDPGILSHPIPTNRTCPSESTPEIRKSRGALRGGRAVHHGNALKRSLLRLLRGERDMFQHFPIESMVIGICSIIFPYFRWSLGWFRGKNWRKPLVFP